MLQWLTVLVPVEHRYIPLFVIFRTARFRETYKDYLAAGSVAYTSYSCYISENLFLNWPEEFQSQISRKMTAYSRWPRVPLLNDVLKFLTWTQSVIFTSFLPHTASGRCNLHFFCLSKCNTEQLHCGKLHTKQVLWLCRSRYRIRSSGSFEISTARTGD